MVGVWSPSCLSVQELIKDRNRSDSLRSGPPPQAVDGRPLSRAPGWVGKGRDGWSLRVSGSVLCSPCPEASVLSPPPHPKLRALASSPGVCHQAQLGPLCFWRGTESVGSALLPTASHRGKDDNQRFENVLIWGEVEMSQLWGVRWSVSHRLFFLVSAQGTQSQCLILYPLGLLICIRERLPECAPSEWGILQLSFQTAYPESLGRAVTIDVHKAPEIMYRIV